MSKIESIIADFIRKHIILIGFGAIALLAFLLRWALIDHETGDWLCYLSLWINDLKKYDGISGIGQEIGEYYVPYMLFLNIAARTPFNDLHEIKLLSILFDYLLAVSAVFMVCGRKQFFTGKGFALFSAILLSPIIFVDSAFWGQCDSIYITALVCCLYFLFRNRDRLAWIFFGIGLALKLQTVFLLPVLLIYYLTTKRISIIRAGYAVFVFLVAALPAIFAGRGIKDTLTIYLRQTGLFNALTLSCPNLYWIISGDYEMFRKMGILLTLSILGLSACLFIKRKYTSKYAYMTLAVWTSMVCIFFLPEMHERYVYLSCVLSMIWAAMTMRKTDIGAAAGISLVCLISFKPYLFQQNEVRLDHLALCNLAILAFLTYRLLTIPAETADTAPAALPANPAPAAKKKS